jgi:hypothetical protein
MVKYGERRNTSQKKNNKSSNICEIQGERMQKKKKRDNRHHELQFNMRVSVLVMVAAMVVVEEPPIHVCL